MTGQAPFPNLPPDAQPWGRWVTEQLQGTQQQAEINATNVDAALSTAASNAGAVEQINNTVTDIEQGQTSITAIPQAPQNVSVLAATSGWTPTGNPFSSVVLNWDGVTTDTSGEPIEISSYQVLLSNQTNRTETRRNFNLNPKLLNDHTGWSIVGTGVTFADSADGVVVDFASATNTFSFYQTLVTEAAEAQSWVSSISVYVPDTYPAVTLKLAEAAYDSGSGFLSQALGTSVTINPGESAVISSGVLNTPINTAGVRTVLFPDGTVPAGGKIVVAFGMHERGTAPTVYFDGDTPNNETYSYEWTGTPNASASRELKASDPMTAIGAIAAVNPVDPDTDPMPVQSYTIEALVPGTTYFLVVRAISVFGVLGEPSVGLEYTTPAATSVALPPSDPILETKLGIVSVSWDGRIGDAVPLPGFNYVFAEFTTEGTEDWAQFGQQLRRPGSVTLTNQPIGTTVRIRLRSVDTLNNISDPSAEVSVVVVGVSGPDIEANAITANHIIAGAIEVTHLSPSVGESLDISANDTINLIVGNIDNTNATLEQLQTVYSFTPTEAIISALDSNFTLAMDNDSIEIREGGVPVSWWNAGQMFVPSFVGDTVILGNHQLEKYGTGTVMRAI